MITGHCSAGRIVANRDGKMWVIDTPWESFKFMGKIVTLKKLVELLAEGVGESVAWDEIQIIDEVLENWPKQTGVKDGRDEA